MKNGHLKIDRGVPIPERTGGGRQSSEFTSALSKMKVGDSLFLKMKQQTLGNRAQMWSHYHRNGFKWSCRTEKDGARLWMIK